MKNVNEIKLAKDPDLFVGMLANDPRHLARAKAKVTKAARANTRAATKVNINLDTTSGACLAALGLVALVLAFLV